MTEIELKYYHLACSFFAKNAKDEPKEIDWEQRRYEIARDMMRAMISQDASAGAKPIAIRAVCLADMLIEQLKK